MEKPSLPKGTRDFGPVVMAKRQFILDSIKKVFQKYGFQPLETPAMENLTTLTGKYGDEGDKLLFKILDSGLYLEPLRGSLSLSEIDQKSIQYFFENLASKMTDKFWNAQHENLQELVDFINQVLDEVFSESNLKENVKSIISNFLENESNYVAFEFSNKVYPPRTENAQILTLYQEELNFSISKIIKQIRRYYAFETSENIDEREVTRDISEKGLRYDLTVPFARYVVMNRGEITFPFKRYQIQPVWRADRPQKGRYREFYQCDADVVGTDSLICEAEIILMIKEVFKSLKISDYSIKINHRGILSGLAEVAGAKDNETALFVAIDKLDKIGEEKVKEELRTKGFDDKSLNAVFEILNKQGSTTTKIDLLTKNFSTSDKGKKGIADLSAVLQLLKDYGVSEDHVEFDISLARGLSYYTGCIFEVKINNVAIGSVSGGGRYDNLTQAFGARERLSGVGISFGVDRLFDAMEELKLFPEEAQISSTVLITHFDSESQRYGLSVLQTLRSNNIAAEIYPDTIKIQKQLDYANKKMIPYVIVIGSEEVKSGLLAFKNMKTGTQEKISIESITDYLR
jgi:histidyl-tRNA synthetase